MIVPRHRLHIMPFLHLHSCLHRLLTLIRLLIPGLRWPWISSFPRLLRIINNAASSPLRATPINDATTTPSDSHEYIDALDANTALTFYRHPHTYYYIISRNDENHSNLEKLAGQTYMCRWPQEWANKIEALRKFKGQRWVDDVQMMSCIKIYGLSKAEDGSLIVRNHKSNREPQFF